jgi:hypothetical protein
MAARSEYFEFSDEMVRLRRNEVGMNDPVAHDDKG